MTSSGRSVQSARIPRAAVRPGGDRKKIRNYTQRFMTVRTFSPKAKDIQPQWHVVDASDVILGRLASQVASLLRGKHKPIYAPHMDTGDFVIVVNAEKVALSGNKLAKACLPAFGIPRRPPFCRLPRPA